MTNNRISEVQTSHEEPEQERRIFSFKVTQLVWLFLGILEALLALRIGLKLIGANPSSPIAQFIYGFTKPFLVPFVGLTDTPAVGEMVLEIPTIFAMLIYALIAWALERILWVIFYRPRGNAIGVTKTTTIDQTSRKS